jgi:WD40 repeat protein
LILELNSSYDLASVAYSPDGKLIAAGTWRNQGNPKVLIWTQPGEKNPSKYLEGVVGWPTNGIYFSPDGKTIYSGMSEDYKATEWDLATGEPTVRADEGLDCFCWAIALSDDGKPLQARILGI